MKKILLIIILLALALLFYKTLQPKDSISESSIDTVTDISFENSSNSVSTDFDDIPPSYVDDDSNSASSVYTSAPAAVITEASTFSCDGRKHCSQMTSCAEATYFIQHCPNTKMDGNNDGIPCEKQWCQ